MTRSESDSSFTRFTETSRLRAFVADRRRSGHRIGFVPTMGALHEGHLSLVAKALESTDCVITSIFVNPMQFAVGEDYSTYPRDTAGDAAKLRRAGATALYLPQTKTIYPEDFSTSITVKDLAGSLCGLSRPHFFGGVATVVCKLLNQVQPDIAIFGEKDFQQLVIIRRMVRDLDLPVDIVGAPTIREANGLAMSSRNAYLSAEGRYRAGTLNRAMREALAKIRVGHSVSAALETASRQILAAGFEDIDYLELRSERDLGLLSPGPLLPEMRNRARLFAAAKIEGVRLIDNISLVAQGSPPLPNP